MDLASIYFPPSCNYFLVAGNVKQYLLTAILFLTDSSCSLLADFLELACSLEVDVETTVLVEAFAAEESNY